MSRRPVSRVAPSVPRNQPVPIATGHVRLVDESDGSTTVLVNSVPSSALHPDPEVLVFEYMQHMSRALELHVDLTSALVIHAGGAACTLPRHLSARWPRSRHLVLEIDAELARLAREWWDLPRAPRMRIRVADAAQVMTDRPPHSADAVVRDTFSGDVVPSSLCSHQWWQRTAEIVRGTGVVVANAGAAPGSSAAADDVMAARDAWPDVAVVGDKAVMAGKRRGNLVAVCGNQLDVDGLRRYAASAALPTSVSLTWPR